MRKAVGDRLSYANVLATLALFFAMSGGALAATHYLINSTKQINPKVLKKLKGKTGATGAAGAAGAAGAQGKEGGQGKEGKQGLRGEEGLEGEPATRLLGSIQSSGAITREQGLTAVKHTVTGAYQLEWARDVSQCYPVANIFASTGYVVMEGFTSNVLTIATFNAAGTATDEAFYVAVLC
jgi:hypothetical protein